jgi:hypothetical protein
MVVAAVPLGLLLARLERRVATLEAQLARPPAPAPAATSGARASSRYLDREALRRQGTELAARLHLDGPTTLRFVDFYIPAEYRSSLDRLRAAGEPVDVDERDGDLVAADLPRKLREVGLSAAQTDALLAARPSLRPYLSR